MATGKLLEANKALLQKQQQARAARAAAGLPTLATHTITPCKQDNLIEQGNSLLERRRRESGIKAPVTSGAAVEQAPAPPARQEETPELPLQAKTYPTLNIALYHADASAGGVLYVMRALNQHQNGGGWLFVDQVRELLTEKGSPWYMFTWRRLRQVLKRGERLGLWHRDDQGRIWLHGVSAIAEALGCGRLRGNPVYIPVAALVAGYGSIRRHFYASWEDRRAEAAPQSRRAIAEQTGIPERTQRHYDSELERETVTNIAFTDIPYTPENVQEHTWDKGRNVMMFTDWTGKRGEAGREILTYQLPSTRLPVLDRAPKGRQRKYNRSITPVNNVARAHDAELVQVYHETPDQAAAAYNRNPDNAHYYKAEKALRPDAGRPSRYGGMQTWETVCA